MGTIAVAFQKTTGWGAEEQVARAQQVPQAVPEHGPDVTPVMDMFRNPEHVMSVVYRGK